MLGVISGVDGRAVESDRIVGVVDLGIALARGESAGRSECVGAIRFSCEIGGERGGAMSEAMRNSRDDPLCELRSAEQQAAAVIL